MRHSQDAQAVWEQQLGQGLGGIQAGLRQVRHQLGEGQP